MKRCLLFIALACLALAPVASATIMRQEWHQDIDASRPAIINFLVDLVNPVPVPDVEVIMDESFYHGDHRDYYVAKFYGWLTVPETGNYQFHYACDDYGMLYVSQDEEMANAVEVAYVDGWCADAEWNKYPTTQHSEVMTLKKGQVMAVMAFFQDDAGGDNMDIGWTGPGLSSDITNPTYLTDYITHIPPTPTLAKGPKPEDGAIDIPRDVVMSWTAGKYAATHDVYFGTAFDDVNAASRSNPLGVLVSQGQAAATYDPAGLLEFDTTYYWRIDEVNAAPSTQIFRGKVWSFTTEPFAYPVANIIATTNGVSDEGSGPERTVDGSGLNAADEHSTEATDMWLALPGAEPLYIQYEFDRVYKLHEMLVWNYNVQFELLLGFGLKGVTVEYSENGADWTTLGDFEFARATAKASYAANTTVAFDGVPVKFVRINVNSGYGMMGQFGLSEVRFMYVPAHAREPQPADGAADVEVGTALAWRSGREAASHEVYLGADPDALALAGTVSSATFAPALEFGSIYYWQVVEVNEADAVTAWTGDLWSFSTQDYASIDGFETYNDDIEAGTAIFDTWLDGWVNDTGSTVGYIETPFAEKSIVHGGSQSMPFQYDNATSPFYSEAWREFETAQNWTGNGADTLVLYVRGNAPSFKETADGGVIMSAIGTDIWNTTDQFRYAYKSLSGDGSITV
ncbi:MAG TPA: PA14 domain-containing protein, partial [Sedimentisphaerales bacterium]|nr:PA14 domain-containing protein [Sedimentisphaerales bacterium]